MGFGMRLSLRSRSHWLVAAKLAGTMANNSNSKCAEHDPF